MGQRTSKQETPAISKRSSVVLDNASSVSYAGDRSSTASIPHTLFARSKRKLTRIELFSLQQMFEELKTVHNDHVECIEQKDFLTHLNLPPPAEPAGVLLFNSFSYIGTHGTRGTEATALTFPSFIIAFAFLTGKMDGEESCPSFEHIFFESLAIPRDQKAEVGNNAIEIAAEGVKEQPTQVDEISTASRSSKGLSLADLGIDFSDLDFDTVGTPDAAGDEDTDDPRILVRDLTDLLNLIFWIVQMEKDDGLLTDVNMQQTNEGEIRELAERLVASIPVSKDSVTQRQFFEWKERNAPNLYRTIQSFIYSRFAMSGQLLITTTSDLILTQDITSIPEISDILTLPYSTLLSWCLPAQVQKIKRWPRLYSANEDGFAMNRFESHVFKYPGPTLAVIQGETSKGPIILASYVHESWKQSKHYWGTENCFIVQLAPEFEVFTPTGRNSQYVYYHHDYGIGFGGTRKIAIPPTESSLAAALKDHISHTGFVVALHNSLQEGIFCQEAYPDLPTYLNSATRAKFHEPFETVNIEVFGLGDDKARKIQDREWEFEKREAQRRAGLQFRQADGKAVDKELLRMAGLIDEDNGQDH
ncbi:TLD-domain-containing protein [Dichotomocladium elegans]|nr:TLD-domain-containing protein [Dichotomocladium elegans]